MQSTDASLTIEMIIWHTTGLFNDDCEDCKAKDQEYLVAMQRHWLNLGHLLTGAEHLYEFTEDASDDACEAMGPDNLCVGAGLAIVSLPNVVKIACKIVKAIMTAVAYPLMVAATIAYQVIDDEYTLATLGENQAIYGYYYSRATYLNTLGHNKWNKQALEALVTNVKNQHMEMKKQLQERHKDIANHVGEDIADAQNALGHAIVNSQNEIGQSIIDSQNALGQSIVDSQNANGEAIVDAQNYITLQHNTLSQWLHSNLCVIYEALNGTCESFIGPLEEDQVFVPFELSWPENQPTMMERLEQLQSSLSIGTLDGAKDGSLSSQRLLGLNTEANNSLELEAIKDKVDALEGKFGLHSEDLQAKVAGVDRKMDSLSLDMVDAVESKVGAVESKVGAVESKVGAVESKVDSIESSMKEIERKLSKMMDLLAKE